MSVTVKMKPTSTIKARLGIQNGGPAHKFFTDTCYKHMDKYVPMRPASGNLRKIVQIDVDKIIYLQPYASYQYYGQRRDGTHKVQNYSTPGTGPYWDKRMWSAEKNIVIEETQNYIKTHGGN